MIIFNRIATQHNTFTHECKLMRTCFPKTNKFNHAYLNWLYLNNPEGHVIGFNAWDKDQLVAHYACIPKVIDINGETVRALLSLNTATHPNYQGQQLFTKLANMTYELAAAEGYAAVFGIANANSTPGFTKKLGFQLVEPLEARLGIGSLNIDFSLSAQNAVFHPVWTHDTFSWRCANPNNPVFKQHQSNNLHFHAAAYGKIPVYAEHIAPPHKIHEMPELSCSGRQALPLRLFIGLQPKGMNTFRHYYNIPQCFRPSPLNFIYRSLDDKTKILDKGSIHLSFMDFDAY